jgi:hypothetical protein
MGVRTSFWEKRTLSLICCLIEAGLCTLSVIGPRPVSKSSVAALTRDRLSHVDQNYVRPETIRAANHRLIEAQGQIALAAQWGGGLVASADGLRFVVPVATLNARPNPLVNCTNRSIPSRPCFLVLQRSRTHLWPIDGVRR